MKKIFMPQGEYQITNVRFSDRAGTDDLIIDFFDGQKLVALVEVDKIEFLVQMTKLYIGSELKNDIPKE